MYRKKIVGFSLKLYINKMDDTKRLMEKLVELTGNDNSIEQFIFPGMGLLYPTSKILEHSTIGLGAQNICQYATGPYTGEFSIESLIEMKGKYVEIGHTERRTIFKETNKEINMKIKLTLANNLIPVLCIGEPIRYKSYDEISNFLEKQLKLDLLGIDGKGLTNLIIAYEPVWSIGKAVAADSEHIKKVHKIIRRLIANFYGDTVSEKIRIIYGGSVSAENAKSIIQQDDVDGVFIGRFGHQPMDYKRIVDIVKDS